MTHWTEKYLGREWTPEFDCAALVQEVLREEFDMEPALPAGFDWRRTEPETVVELARDFAVRTDEPRDGDGILMRIRGNRRDLGSHVGVYVDVAGEPWVLHNIERAGVLFHPIHSAERLHLETMGFYRWLTD